MEQTRAPDFQSIIATFSILGILTSLFFNTQIPLYVVLILGGLPVVGEIFYKLFRGNWGADVLAGLAIVTAALLDQYLAACLVILMFSGGQAIENYSVRTASHVLSALAKRAPSIAHRLVQQQIQDIPVSEIKIEDELVIYPHEICPVDGIVIEGDGSMDEAYLTGEPFLISKTTGSEVLSGAINGDVVLTIRATRLAVDSRYERIMQVMQDTEKNKPRMRRLADKLGAIFSPIALAIAIIAGLVTGDPVRFLAVLVVATPCPLLIGIPVAIISAISLCATRGIIIKNPKVLEELPECKTMIFDKTGTLTYGKAVLTEIKVFSDFSENDVLRYAASLEQYSKHPLAKAILNKAKAADLNIAHASSIQEIKSRSLTGIVENHKIRISSRKQLIAEELLPPDEDIPTKSGLECFMLIDEKLAGYFHFTDAPRKDSYAFIQHLSPEHGIEKIMILSGDRKTEVADLARMMGVQEIYAEKTPEEKLAIVRQEAQKAKTAYLGDGINDAPALMAAQVGIAMGKNSDITAEAAGAVILDNSMEKVDEFFHISTRMRQIALQSAVGGMLLSTVGMIAAACGLLAPVAGALAQECIDIIAILNALRVLWKPKSLSHALAYKEKMATAHEHDK